MAQLSLYLDNEIYGKVRTAAHSSGISTSKYVAALIQDHFTHEWPKGYSELFGSVLDDTFFPNGAEKILDDTPREPL
ncbi:MAG: hypothetical protein LBQ94_07835, partial [Treponema sp.]|nr:hypothetical protein [Treponema sp.]